MSRYSRRRVSRSTRSSSGFHPVVAFLIIASFGILFAGCGKVQGPQADEELQDTTFTAGDIEALERVGGESSDESSVASATGSADSALSSISSIARVTPATGTGSTTVAAADPALRQRYDALRAMADTGAGNMYRVTNTFVNVRATPATGGASVGQLNQGEMVAVTEFVNAAWAKVSLPNNVTGYVSARYISRLTTDARLPQEKKATEGMYFVDYAFVNIRKEMNVQSEKLGEIPGQALLKPTAITGEWAKVSYDGKEGYVSMQFLSPFTPTFIVRQESFALPVLRYDVSEATGIETLVAHAAKLRESGTTFTTFRAFHDLLLAQEVRDVRVQPKSVIIAVTGITPQNVKRLSDALYGANIPATLFIETRHLGLSGISQKLIATLRANGFDLQSAGHTGDDLRSLTNAQLMLELQQSRQLLEDMANQSVFAVAYPGGRMNDRVAEAAANAGYLFGVGSLPEKTYSRDQFLKMPAYEITSSMAAEDVVRLMQ